MKKILAMLMTLTMTVALLSGCAGVPVAMNDSVKEEVEAMIGMMTQSETRQVVFYWSEMVFAGEVISLDVRYTMFNVAGNPIRAVVRLTVRESTETGKSEYWTKAFDDLEREGSNFKKVGNLLGFN